MSLGLGLQQYTALVLFADEDIDFVQEMVEKLEGEYGLKVGLIFYYDYYHLLCRNILSGYVWRKRVTYRNLVLQEERHS